jgi:hypothetical protein
MLGFNVLTSVAVADEPWDGPNYLTSNIWGGTVENRVVGENGVPAALAK